MKRTFLLVASNLMLALALFISVAPRSLQAQDDDSATGCCKWGTDAKRYCCSDCCDVKTCHNSDQCKEEA